MLYAMSRRSIFALSKLHDYKLSQQFQCWNEPYH